MAALLRIIGRHLVVAFMVIGLGAYLLTAAIPPIVNAQVLPFALPLHVRRSKFLGSRSPSHATQRLATGQRPFVSWT